MLRALSIQNFILIKSLIIEFYKGFSTLTGETGTGKSLILEALLFALGARANYTIALDKSQPVMVSTEFDITNVSINDICELAKDNTLVLRRVLNTNGKSRIFCNQNIISITQARRIGERLVEICNQHAQHGLFNKTTHLNILDTYANLMPLRDSTASIFAEWQDAKKKLSELMTLSEKQKAEQEYYKTAITEIQKLNPILGEEEALIAKRGLLLTKGKLYEALTEAIDCLTGNNSAYTYLTHTNKCLMKFPKQCSAIANRIESLMLEVGDISQTLSNLYNSLGTIENLELIEERLFSLKDLARKYHTTVEKLYDLSLEIQQRIHSFETLIEQLDIAKERELKLQQDYLAQAVRLSQARQIAALKIEQAIMYELAAVKMEKAEFRVLFTKSAEKEWSANGIDKVQFMMSTNTGFTIRSLNEIASGGELSRIMLACKIALMEVQSLPTIVFDEIDSGIGGEISSKVGQKLITIAHNTQVIAVTHQPQVAVHADTHYLAIKTEYQGNTNIEIRKLSYIERQREIARMLSGAQITEASMLAAEILLQEAKTTTPQSI